MKEYFDVDTDINSHSIVDQKTKRMIDENHKLHTKLVVMRLIVVACFLITGLCATSLMMIRNETIQLKNECAELKVYKEQARKKNKSFYKENCKMVSEYTAMYNLLIDVSKISDKLNKEVSTLKKTIKNKDKSLRRFEKREELLTQYEWALYNEERERTDISYKDIESLQNLIKKKHLNEDTIDLILALAMTESNGDAECTSNESTATGLNQFIQETGEFVYKQLMGNQWYSHSITKDPSTSLTMTAYYLEWLNMEEKRNIDSIIDRYRGIKSPEYKKRVNSYLLKNNKSLASINIK